MQAAANAQLRLCTSMPSVLMMPIPTNKSFRAQGFLLVTITLALQVDVVVAKAQRRDLGICETCGGVYNPDECARGNCPKK